MDPERNPLEQHNVYCRDCKTATRCFYTQETGREYPMRETEIGLALELTHKERGTSCGVAKAMMLQPWYKSDPPTKPRDVIFRRDDPK